MADLTPYLPKLGGEDSPIGRDELPNSTSARGNGLGASQHAKDQDFTIADLEDISSDDAETSVENTISDMISAQNYIGNSPKGPSDSCHGAGQGQHFEPMDKSVSQTVKLNPKMELSRQDLLKLLSYMEAELQARDVVIATLKTERIKNLLHFGRIGLNDPFLALQRDSIGGRVTGGATLSENEIRHIEETQLQQLENLIIQQRRAHQRMRQVLREAEKRHAWTVEELEKERRKHEQDAMQGDEVAWNEEKDHARFKQELDSERTCKKKAELEVKRLEEMLEEERSKQKQIILMLLEVRKRLALQYIEERKRSEDLAQILSEEKGRIDSMAEGLEEESKKSLQMEAELEKQLAEFDLERQQMRAQLMKKEEKMSEQETTVEKLQREVEHYKKQLQEAHNVAMFQQTLSVSPPRIGIGTTQPQRPHPPQLPVKPPSLTQSQPKLQTSATLSTVTKAVQLTATVNSVPVSGPTTGIARGIQPSTAVRPSHYSTTSELSRSGSTSKSYSDNDPAWTGSATLESDQTRISNVVSDAPRVQAQGVQVSPRVNVSASSGSKVITTSHGGKVTFHVTTNASPSAVTLPSLGQTNGQAMTATAQPQQQQLSKKPLPPNRSLTPSGNSNTLGSLNKPLSAPPVPPNKPAVPPKKDIVSGRTAGSDSSPISVEVKPQKVGPQTVKFGITISKGSSAGAAGAGVTPQAAGSASQSVIGSVHGAIADSTTSGAAVESAISSRRETTQVEDPGDDPELHACVRSLTPELEHFHQLLNSMAGSPNIVVEHPDTSISLDSFHSLNTSVYSECNQTYTSEIYQPISDTEISPTEANQPSESESNETLSRSDSGSNSSNSSRPPLTFKISSSQSLITEDESSDCTQMGLPVTCLDNLSSNIQLEYPSVINPVRIHSNAQANTSLLSHSGSASDDQLYSNSSASDGNTTQPLLDVATPLTADGMTALHLAAQGNNWESVPVLIRCGSSVNAEDDEGRTPLYIALLNGCTTAALSLLSYSQSMEMTTKFGRNLFHAAIKSQESKCVSALCEHLVSVDGNTSVMHLLLVSEDHSGVTPLSLALAYSSSRMVEELISAGLDIHACLAHHPELFNVSSPSARVLLSNAERKVTCCVYLEGAAAASASVLSESRKKMRWAVGCVLVTPNTLWTILEEELISILRLHWESIDGQLNADSVAAEMHHDVTDDVDKVGLGFGVESIRCFSIGSIYWKMGTPSGSKLPYEVLTDSDHGGSKEINIYLHPIDSVAYTCFVPVPMVKRYLRMLHQSKCVVIYGAVSSGKKTLARCLASLLCDSSSDFSKMDLGGEPVDNATLSTSTQLALASGTVLVLERVSKDHWPILWESLKNNVPRNGTFKSGHVLATLDSWRRPSGQQETEVLWIQLRHDKEPLKDLVSRCLKRELCSRMGGVPLPSTSLSNQMVGWIGSSYSRFCDMIMSLGFSSVLRGPRLLLQRLLSTSNPKDMLVGITEVWSDEIVPAIRDEVHSLWQTSPRDTGRIPDKSRVSAMAFHIILQRTFLAGVPPPIERNLLLGFQAESLVLLKGPPKTKSPGGVRPDVPPRPKDLNVRPSKGLGEATPPTPASPEWNEDNLVKLLGLHPMGYS